MPFHPCSHPILLSLSLQYASSSSASEMTVTTLAGAPFPDSSRGCVTLAICLGSLGEPWALKEATEAGAKQSLGEMPWLKCSQSYLLRLSVCPVSSRFRGRSDAPFSSNALLSPSLLPYITWMAPIHVPSRSCPHLHISTPVVSQEPRPSPQFSSHSSGSGCICVFSSLQP